MPASLTIALPTYNRARLLAKQLDWLAHAVAGNEERCDVIVSDNCSTDETPRVVADWRGRFSAPVRVNRHKDNIGAIRNIAYCIESARTPYVWTIGDDDEIDREALAYVLGELDAHPDLGLLTLNFSSRIVQTGELRFERCFDVEDEQVYADGKPLFARLLEEDPGGIALTTAQVYRSDLAQRAIREWRWGLRNLVVQIYWTAFCAAHGSAKVTKETYLECAAGTHFFFGDPRLAFKLDLGDTAELYSRLAKIGYSPELCRRLMIKQLAGSKRRIVKGTLRWPATGAAVVGRIVKSLVPLSARSFRTRGQGPGAVVR